MVKGLRDWPVIQLLADLEVPDLAELQAIGRQLHSNQLVRFLPSPQARRNAPLCICYIPTSIGRSKFYLIFVVLKLI